MVGNLYTAAQLAFIVGIEHTGACAIAAQPALGPVVIAGASLDHRVGPSCQAFVLILGRLDIAGRGQPRDEIGIVRKRATRATTAIAANYANTRAVGAESSLGPTVSHGL